MKLLKVFNKENVSEDQIRGFEKKKQVRVIIFDRNNKIGLLYSKNGDFYEIPGGGVEKGESNQQAATREAKEETGCDVKIEKLIGKTIEVRKKKNLVNETHCYTAHVISEKGDPSFQENELEVDFIVLWKSLEDAEILIKRNKVSDNLYYNYLTERALIFIEQAKQIRV